MSVERVCYGDRGPLALRIVVRPPTLLRCRGESHSRHALGGEPLRRGALTKVHHPHRRAAINLHA